MGRMATRHFDAFACGEKQLPAHYLLGPNKSMLYLYEHKDQKARQRCCSSRQSESACTHALALRQFLFTEGAINVQENKTSELGFISLPNFLHPLSTHQPLPPSLAEKITQALRAIPRPACTHMASDTATPLCQQTLRTQKKRLSSWRKMYPMS